MNNRTLKIRLTVLVASLLGVLAVYLFLNLWMKARLGDVYPDSATSKTMQSVKRRVLHYAKHNNKLPHTVDGLPVLEGINNNNRDYWGGEIVIQVEGTTVSLISYGKDKKPGGTGANLDLVAVFEAKTPAGFWADENDEGTSSWKKQPVVRWRTADYR